MKEFRTLLLIILLLFTSFSLCSCTDNEIDQDESGSIESEDSYPTYSSGGANIENIITYFNEVCLDAEFVNSGDASYVQKWCDPIKYFIHGNYSDTDLQTLQNFASWLNTIEGFPGLYPVDNSEDANLQIYFTDYQEMLNMAGENAKDCDGFTTFWWNEYNEIYQAEIFYRTDISQTTRNSVILEEIYNTLGPLQDTSLRPDSIIYSGFSTTQILTPMDELIIKLLYHPQITCGMNAPACETIIKEYCH
ncbi:MAG: DUF2927 domain-containing protein [Firmicutes bacterium]|nr:DUF2927 domain-containing protein [Bacillota bacterium]